MSNSLWTHGLQHARPPCPSPTPKVYSHSRPLSHWCHPTISSSVVPFSSCLQSFPESGSFPISQFFPSDGQVLGFQLLHQSFQWIFRTNFLENGLVGSPCSPRDSQESSPTPQFKSINSSVLSFLYSPLSHPYMATWKTAVFTRRTFVGKEMTLLLNMLSRLAITFLPRSKRLLISWLQSPSAVILEPPKESLTLFPLFPHLFPMKWWDWMPWSSFLNVEL